MNEQDVNLDSLGLEQLLIIAGKRCESVTFVQNYDNVWEVQLVISHRERVENIVAGDPARALRNAIRQLSQT